MIYLRIEAVPTLTVVDNLCNLCMLSKFTKLFLSEVHE